MHLEYKHIDKLKDKRRLVECISSFANSEGGLLILGVSEKKDKNRHYPDQITWGDSSIKGIDIENMIKDRTEPSLKVFIIQIRKSLEDPQVIFLIEIPKSNNLYMVDYRFFKRLNFQSVKMKQLEVVSFIKHRLSYDSCAMFRLQLEEFLREFVDEMLYRLIPEFKELNSRKEVYENIIQSIVALIKTWDQTKIAIMENTPIIQLIRLSDHVTTIYVKRLEEIGRYPHNGISPEEELLFSELKKLIDNLGTPYLGLGGLRSFLREDAEAHGKSRIGWELTPLEFGIEVKHKDHVLHIVDASLDLTDLLECVLKLMKKLDDLKRMYGDFKDSPSVVNFYSDH